MHVRDVTRTLIALARVTNVSFFKTYRTEDSSLRDSARYDTFLFIHSAWELRRYTRKEKSRLKDQRYREDQGENKMGAQSVLYKRACAAR